MVELERQRVVGYPIALKAVSDDIHYPAGDAEAMIAATCAEARLAGSRGRPPGDLAALARCLTALADFAWAERHHLGA